MTAAIGANTRCPRCGGGFRCGADDAEPCACTTMTLDAAVLLDLRRRYDGCLCLRCLESEAAAAADDGPAARRSGGDRVRAEARRLAR